MNILETDRLSLSLLSEKDGSFMLRLLNTPSWIRFIGDRKVRTEDAAVSYILNGPVKGYERFGFGFYLVKTKQDDLPVGICGLVKRDSLEDVDIGFAFLPEHEGLGYGYESASAVLSYAQETLGMKRILAITTPDNTRSIRLLEKIGLRFEKMILDKGEELMLLAVEK